MKQLVERWAQLEPRDVEIRIYGEEPNTLHYVQINPDSWSDEIGFKMADVNSNLIAIEHEIRKRIEARGWEWQCGYATDIHGNMRHYASIMGEHTRSGPTPAVAILSAYLAALEALKADAR